MPIPRPRSGSTGQAVQPWIRAHDALLLTAEIAVCVALLAVSGVIAEGNQAERRQPSNPPAEILTATLYLDALDTDSARVSVVANATARAATDRRLTHFAVSSALPGLPGATVKFALSGTTYPPTATLPQTRLSVVSPAFFDVLQLRPSAGRLLSAGDDSITRRLPSSTTSSPGTISPAGRPSGRAFSCAKGATRHGSRSSACLPTCLRGIVIRLWTSCCSFHLPSTRACKPQVIATGPGTMSVTADAVQSMLRVSAQASALEGIEPLSAALERARRKSSSLATVFAQCGVAGLILTAIGLYGVTDTASRRRARELAIRQALGSTPGHVARLVVQESGIPLAIGLGAGGLAAFGVAPSLSWLLFGENPHDPTVYAAVIGLLTAVMIIAAGRPALRAANSSIVDTLREG